MRSEIEKFKSFKDNAEFWNIVNSAAEKQPKFNRPLPPTKSKPPNGEEMLSGAWIVEQVEVEEEKANTTSSEAPRVLFFCEQQLFAINSDKSITRMYFEVKHGSEFNLFVSENRPDSAEYLPNFIGTFPHWSAENMITISRVGCDWSLEQLYVARCQLVDGREETVMREMKKIEDRDLNQLKGQGKTHDLVNAFAAIAEFQRTGKFPNGTNVKRKLESDKAKEETTKEQAFSFFMSTIR